MQQRSVAIAVVILLCITLVLAGYFLTRPTNHKGDWAWGPAVPGSQPTASAPAAPLPPRREAVLSPQMLLGDPSGATADANNRNNFLMVKPYFCLAYNDSAGEPRWVSWRVCAADLGDAPRKRVFDQDATLPGDYYRVQTHDYTGSGFDRGHMCPHSDRAATIGSSYATFIMSNIVPQAPANNRKAWAQLENYGRELVRAGDRLYISSGPCGRGGVGSKGAAASLAGGRITVPAETWKIIVVTVDTGRDDLANVNADDRVIAVAVPNDNDRVGEEWAGFRCSPASIEAKTGLHFFGALPPAVAAALDAKVDSAAIAPPRPLVHTGAD